MVASVQEQVDGLQAKGLPALQQMQRVDPKMLVGIAIDNLEQDLKNDQRAKQMGGGDVGPPVIDKKLAGLASLGQRQAVATASPGLQLRGRQMQAEQMRKAMQGQPQMAPRRMAEGGVARFENGGAVDIENLLNALMITESGGDPQAVGSVGELGAYQIRPSTAADPGFRVAPFTGDLTDPVASRNFARDYLQAFLDRYDGDVEAALIAYNAGAGNADNFIAAGRDYDVLPQTGITKPYVNKIMTMAERRVPTPNPGRIGSARAARSMRGLARDARDFLGNIFEDTRPESVRRDEVDFNRKVRAANQALREGKTRAERAAAIQEVKDAIAKEKETEVEQGFDFTPEEVEQGGLGYLQSIGRMQEETADNAADYLRMMQNQEDMISRANPATTMRGIDTDRVFDTERSIKSPAQRFEEAFPGSRDAAARYALDKAAGLTALQQTPPPETRTRSNNPLVNLGADLGEIGGYLRRVLGFQEGGEIKNFQEGDIVEVDGEQVIPLSSVSDDPGFVEKGFQLLKDNPDVALTLGLMVIPYLGPGLSLGRLAASRAAAAAARRFGPQATRGLAGLRRAGSRAADSPFFSKPRKMPKDFKIEDPTLLTKAGKPTTLRGRKGFEAATKPRAAVERIPGAPRTRRGKPIGGRNPDIRRASPARGPLISARQFSPGRTAQTAGAGYIASRGLAGLLGGDETQATPRDTSNLPRNRPFDVEAFSEAFPELAEEMRQRPQVSYDEQLADVRARNVRDEGTDRSGILRNLGTALTSDNARALYSAFADLGLAGGASRGFEGAQLAENLAARDFQQQELDAMQRAMDIDEAQLQTQRDISERELLNELVSSGTFMSLQNQIADELDLEPESQKVISETLKRIITAMGGAGLGEFTKDILADDGSTLNDADSIVGI